MLKNTTNIYNTNRILTPFFLSDWAKVPGAIVDTKTTNKSWLRMAKLYRDKLNLPNWGWHLALINPNLQDVDPYDPNLSDIEKLWVLEESRLNPMYYIREVIRLPPSSGDTYDKVRVNRGDLATFFFTFQNINTANLQMRQTGKTIKLECPLQWALTIGCKNTKMIYSTSNNTLKKKVIEGLKKKIQHLPDYFQAFNKKYDLDNTEAITCHAQNNYLNFVIGQASEEAARKSGMGHTVAITLYDEIAETKNSHHIIPAAQAASGAAKRYAIENGLPNFTLYGGTAYTLDKPEGKNWESILNRGIKFSERIMFTCENRDELIQLLKDMATSERGRLVPLVNITMSYADLGYSKEDHERLIANSEIPPGDTDKIDQQYNNRFTSGSINNPLSPTQLRVIHSSEREPVYDEMTNEGYLLKFYVDLDEFNYLNNEGLLVASLDTSNAIGRDACSMTVLDIRTGRPVMRNDVYRTNLLKYGTWLTKLLQRFDKMILIIENASSGTTLLDIIISGLVQAGINPVKRLYNRIIDDYKPTDTIQRELLESEILPSEITVDYFTPYKNLFGFKPTARKRVLLYNTVLIESVKMIGNVMADSNLIKQIKALIIDQHGRVDHPKEILDPETGEREPGHDDAVISLLLGIWFLLFGKNLEYYSWNKREILSLATSSENGILTDSEKEQQLVKNKLNKILDKLLLDLKITYDSTTRAMLIEKINNVNTILISFGGGRNNMDQIINGIDLDTDTINSIDYDYMDIYRAIK